MGCDLVFCTFFFFCMSVSAFCLVLCKFCFPKCCLLLICIFSWSYISASAIVFLCRLDAAYHVFCAWFLHFLLVQHDCFCINTGCCMGDAAYHVPCACVLHLLRDLHVCVCNFPPVLLGCCCASCAMWLFSVLLHCSATSVSAMFSCPVWLLLHFMCYVLVSLHCLLGLHYCFCNSLLCLLHSMCSLPVFCIFSWSHVSVSAVFILQVAHNTHLHVDHDENKATSNGTMCHMAYLSRSLVCIVYFSWL